MQPLKVEKRGGQQEDFDRSKIVKGITAAGATPEQAESIASQVETWAQGAAVNNLIKTSDIRVKVLELLKAANPTAGAAFEAYKKPA